MENNNSWENLTYPNIARDRIAKLNLANDLKEKQEKKQETNKEIICHHCEETIKEYPYYQCVYHHNLFCEKCAKQKGEFSLSATEKCKQFSKCKQQKLDKKDCIWVKIEPTEKGT